MTVSRYFFHKLATWLSSKGLFLTKSLSYRKIEPLLRPNLDHIRYATLGLCCEEIIANNISGSVAELGVYKGDFSKKLNFLFPERKLYLFDTFEGFNNKDIAIEHKKGYSSAAQDFCNTSIEFVKRQMPYPANCVFMPGHFPESARGLEDQFCLVHIDADLFEPIYQGLVFFYPRLEKGGYIFIHDFNNEEYPGARQAVLRFCRDSGIGYTPLPDSGGTVVIVK